MKENKEYANDPGGPEADLKGLEMGQAVGGGGETSERHGELGDEP